MRLPWVLKNGSAFTGTEMTSDNTLSAIHNLRKKGYRIVATSPHTQDDSLQDFNLEKGKAAVFFGTELTGISATVLDQADELIKIPMYGFTESYNISVSVALAMQKLISRLQSSDIDWQLSKEEQDTIMLEWLRKSIKNVQFIEKQFLNKKK